MVNRCLYCIFILLNALSVVLHGEGKELFHYLMKQGVVTDWREPAVIRLAPVPLYTTFEEMYEFGQILKTGIQTT